MASKSADRANPYFRFLRRMHAGGRSNMYGAIPYLSAAFGCDRDEAYRIVCEWVDLQAREQGSAHRDESSAPPAPAPATADPARRVASPRARRKPARGRRG